MDQKIRGTRDWTGRELARKKQLQALCCALAEQMQFEPIETPILEFQKLFVRSLGNDTEVIHKEMYQFADKKNRLLALRPEGTAGVVRAVLENKLMTSPYETLRYFYYEPMFRYERPQKNRLRQFTQFGLEIINSQSIYDVVLLCSFSQQLIAKCQLANRSNLHVNYLATKATKEKFIKALQAFLHTVKLCDNCVRRQKTNPLRILDCKIDASKMHQAPVMLDFLTKTEQAKWQQFTDALEKNNISFVIDPYLVRGLDYYEGCVFEWMSKEAGQQNTLIGGGSYGSLFTTLGSKEALSATGLAIGMERLQNEIDTYSQTFWANDVLTNVLVLPLSAEYQDYAYEIVTFLHKNNVSVNYDFSKQSLAAKLKNKRSAKYRYWIVVGPEELQNRVWSLRDVAKKTNDVCTWEEGLAKIKNKGANNA